MGNQPDYIQFFQIPRSFVKIQVDSFCTTIEEQNTLPLKRNLSQNSIVSVVKPWRIATLYINVGDAEYRALIN